MICSRSSLEISKRILQSCSIYVTNNQSGLPLINPIFPGLDLGTLYIADTYSMTSGFVVGGGEYMEHTFSIELSSKKYVRHLTVSDTSPDRVFFEGSLGPLKALSLIEGSTLEIQGVHGVLRVDLHEADIHKMLMKRQEQ